jgi:hypothetical protein
VEDRGLGVPEEIAHLGDREAALEMLDGELAPDLFEKGLDRGPLGGESPLEGPAAQAELRSHGREAHGPVGQEALDDPAHAGVHGLWRDGRVLPPREVALEELHQPGIGAEERPRERARRDAPRVPRRGEPRHAAEAATVVLRGPEGRVCEVQGQGLDGRPGEAGGQDQAVGRVHLRHVGVGGTHRPPGDEAEDHGPVALLHLEALTRVEGAMVP